MKVLFLDIDGVLNKATTKERIGGDSIWAGMHGLDAKLVKLLLDWLKAHSEVVVVLSSTWRLDGRLVDIIEKAGIPLHAVTLSMDGRQREIETWLAGNPQVEAYAILDDMQFFRGAVARRFVQTSYQHGLLPQHGQGGVSFGA